MTDWTETLDGNVIYKFKTFTDNEYDSITLFDASRGIYVKLTATNLQLKYLVPMDEATFFKTIDA